MQAAGVDEVGIFAAQLFGPRVHELHKGVDAAGDVARQRVGALVGGGQKQAGEHVSHGEGLANLETGGHAVLVQCGKILFRNGDGVIQLGVL